jgi:thermitase
MIIFTFIKKRTCNQLTNFKQKSALNMNPIENSRTTSTYGFTKVVLSIVVVLIFVLKAIPQHQDLFHPERVILKLQSQSELLKDVRDVLLKTDLKKSDSQIHVSVNIAEINNVEEIIKNHKTLIEFVDQFPVKAIVPLTGIGFKSENSHGLDRIFILQFDEGNDIPGLVESINKRSDVEYAEPDFIGGGDGQVCDECIIDFDLKNNNGSFPPTDELFNLQYGLFNTGQVINSIEGVPGADINIRYGWEITTGSPDVKIAILDSGVPPEHPEFEGRLISGYNFVKDTIDYTDDHGHGTSVASIAAATGNKGYIAGTDWQAGIIPVKILDDTNSGLYSWWAQGINYAVNQGAHVLNLSIGGSSFSQVLRDAVNYALDNGVIVVACMMNENNNVTYYPAGYTGVISVGATNNRDLRAEPFAWGGGSNWGQHIDFVAPGNLIASLRHNNFTAGVYYSGTSMSAPFVSAIISLMLSIDPDLTRNEVYDILKYTTRQQLTGIKNLEPQWDEFTGWGRVDASAALTMTLAGGFPSNISDQTVKESMNPVKIFPNPAEQFLLVSVRDKIEQIRIIDMQGRVIFLMEGNFPEDVLKLDVKSFDQGIYILQVLSNQQKSNHKLILKRNP